MSPDAVGSLQDNLDRSRPAMLASYGLIGAILIFGAAGWFADRYFGTSPWCLLAGLILGLAIGFYQLREGVRN